MPTDCKDGLFLPLRESELGEQSHVIDILVSGNKMLQTNLEQEQSQQTQIISNVSSVNTFQQVSEAWRYLKENMHQLVSSGQLPPVSIEQFVKEVEDIRSTISSFDPNACQSCNSNIVPCSTLLLQRR